MKNKKRMVVLFVMVGILATCFGLTSIASGQTSDKKDHITLTIFGPDFPYTKTLREVTAKKYEQRTGVKIIVETAPYDVLHQRTVFELTSQSPSFDLICGGGEYAREVIASGYVLSLEPFMADPTLPRLQLEKLLTWADARAIFDGTRYGVTVVDVPDGYIWRKDLFADAGLPGGAKTWDEYRQYAEKLTRGDVFGAVLLMGAQDEGQSGFMRRVYGFKPFEDGRFIVNSKDEVIIDNPKSVRALEMMKELMPFCPPGTLSYAYAEGAIAWKQGRLAQATTWIDMLHDAEDPTVSKVAGLNGYLPMPASEPGWVYNAMAGGNQIWINKASKNQREAYKFIAYLTEGEYFQDIFDGGQLGTGAKAILDNPENWEKMPFLGMWQNITQTLPLSTGHPEFPEEQRIMYDQVSAFLSGEKSAELAIKDMADNLRKLLEKAGYYK